MSNLVVIAPSVVGIIISAVIPILVGLITKATLSSGAKAVFMLILNAVNALVTTAVTTDGSAIITRQAFANFVIGVVISVAAYYGVYKPNNVTSDAGGKLAPTVGIGPSVPPVQ